MSTRLDTTRAADGAVRIGAGGEAEIFTVANRPKVVEKRYRRPGAAQAAKLQVMLEHPPAEATRAGPITLAWPTELVRGSDGAVRGFLMPRVDLTTNVPLFQMYNPQSRRQVAPAFTWRYLVRTARNVAAIVDELHGAGYVVGDLNESNLLVSRQALVTLVDCDSIQVRDPATGDTLRCLVGKADFLAPEFQGRDLSKVDRTDRSDAFALGILVFLLLMEGVHPYAGVWRGRGDAPDLSARLRARRFPYLPLTRVRPAPTALPLRLLPWRVRWLVVRSFVLGARISRLRPTARQWVSALDRLEVGLRRCKRSTHHDYPRRLRRCPWCARIDFGLPDPFPGPSGTSALTPMPPRLRARVRRAVGGRVPAWARRVPTTPAWMPPWTPAVIAAIAAGAMAPFAVVLACALACVAARRAAAIWLRDVALVTCAAATLGFVATLSTGSAAAGGRAWGAGVAATVSALTVRRHPQVAARLGAARVAGAAWTIAVVGVGLAAWLPPTWWPVR